MVNVLKYILTGSKRIGLFCKLCCSDAEMYAGIKTKAIPQRFGGLFILVQTLMKKHNLYLFQLEMRLIIFVIA